ncbi:MAG TPA: hypothetical protein VJ375_08755 [Gaiellaceae bacterium]|jgi:hypothetical protein|nr:hypothetical protein [Gaiellaceae bacterium]
MADADFLSHHRSIQTLLDLATEQLTATQQDRIREAVFARDDMDEARAFIDDTDAEAMGVRFLAAFADADSELQSAQVEELEGLIDARLASSS